METGIIARRTFNAQRSTDDLNRLQGILPEELRNRYYLISKPEDARGLSLDRWGGTTGDKDLDQDIHQALTRGKDYLPETSGVNNRSQVPKSKNPVPPPPKSISIAPNIRVFHRVWVPFRKPNDRKTNWKPGPWLNDKGEPVSYYPEVLGWEIEEVLVRDKETIMEAKFKFIL